MVSSGRGVWQVVYAAAPKDGLTLSLGRSEMAFDFNALSRDSRKLVVCDGDDLFLFFDNHRVQLEVATRADPRW